MRECEEGTESARRERRVDSLVANTARRRLRGDMMDKVQAADMLVTKAQDEIRVKVGQLTAAKWMGKVNLVKKERVIDKIKAAAPFSLLWLFLFSFHTPQDLVYNTTWELSDPQIFFCGVFLCLLCCSMVCLRFLRPRISYTDLEEMSLDW